MKIYVCHAKSFDFLNELYKPLKDAKLAIEFIFPHEQSSESFNSKELFESHGCDYVLAEVSTPSTGQGIELGWADIYGIKILCFYKAGTAPANSLQRITDKTVEYTDSIDLVNKLITELQLHIA